MKIEPAELRIRLQQLHEAENDLNKLMGKQNKIIRLANKEKQKLAKRISHNMRLRNQLINLL